MIGFLLNFEDDTVTLFKNSAFLAKVKLEGPLQGATLYPVAGISQDSVVKFTQRRKPPPLSSKIEYKLLVSDDEKELLNE